MSDKQGSARVTLREIDLSQVRDPEQLPQGVPAAVVGPAKRGPAFVPKTFADMQQFGEVFGSMQEISKDSNANRFAPLALNEWMRNAQAGTFLRVLGVGNDEGRMNDDKTVAGAGFVVGDKVSHDSSNVLQNNPHAQIDPNNVVGATKAARTHLLGCFMKDAVGSTLLQDAGLAGAASDFAEAKLVYSDQPSDGDTITLISTDGTTATYEFESAGGITAGNISVTISNDADATYVNFKNAVDGGVHNGKISVTVTDDNNDSGIITLTQAVAGTSGNTKISASVANLSVQSFATAIAPIVRGLLMTPQGVVPALEVSATAFSAIPAAEANITKDVASGANLIDFGSTAASDLIGYEVGKVSSDQGFKLILNGFKPQDGEESEGQSKVLDCSFDPESVNYFAKVLNTDPLQIESRGHYLHMHWDIDSSKAIPGVSGLIQSDGSTPATLNQAAFCMHTSLGRAARNATIPDLESFNTRFRTAVSPWFVSQKFGDTTYDLFKIHALDDGEVANDRFRILISNIRSAASSTDWGSFDLSLEAFESDPVKGEVIASWKRLSLDPDSRNFIGRVIGTKHMYFDFDRASSKQRLVEEGEFDVRNKYIRVELSDLVASGEVPTSSLVAGFKGYTTLGTTEAGVLVESGDDGSGNNRLLAASSLDGVQPLPLPFVKKITRASGQAFEASEALAWGVKFGKHEKSSELNDIRFNPSMKSWTMFLPDIADSGDQAAGVTSTEMFSLEKIAVDDASDVDWATSEYARTGTHDTKTFITLSDAAAIGKNVKYLKFRCLMQGGFDGVNIFNKDKAELTSAAAHREANEEVSNVFTGPTVVAYQKALDVLKDKSATEFQLLAIPGMREPLVTDYAITACESRFDAMLVMDIEQKDAGDAIVLDPLGKPSVNLSRQRFEDRSLDTSFAAAYFPDVVMRRPSNSSPLQVPPSVSMLGVMSQNDTLADPWFAPAGLTRGRLNALHSKVQMNRELLNDLYDADINPIYEPAGRAGEVYAFGQKTLMRDQSALDRINVRRLLINIRRRVKAVANTLLFEPNRASTLARFSSLVEPIMSEVQARQGVERYKVQIDTSTTTQNDVENNTIRGKIYLQPTKSVEFISLDFVVTNSID